MLCDMGKYVEAIQAYDKAIELNPSFAVAWYNKGRALKKHNHNIEANDAFARARELEGK
jgi:tetratricopeptide (TPR) repeat protein